MSETTPSEWYLGINNEARGPLNFEDVKSLFSSGEANGKTQAWTAGMGDWVDAQTLDALKPLLPPSKLKVVPPALPKAVQMDAAVLQVAPQTAQTAQKVELMVELSPSSSADPVQAGLKAPVLTEGMSFDEVIAALGLTHAQVERMAMLAVELSSHTKTNLGLAPPRRWALMSRAE